MEGEGGVAEGKEVDQSPKGGGDNLTEFDQSPKGVVNDLTEFLFDLFDAELTDGYQRLKTLVDEHLGLFTEGVEEYTMEQREIVKELYKGCIRRNFDKKDKSKELCPSATTRCGGFNGYAAAAGPCKR